MSDVHIDSDVLASSASTHIHLATLGELPALRAPQLDVALLRRTLPGEVARALRIALDAGPCACVYEGSIRDFDASELLLVPLDDDIAAFVEDDVMSLALAYAHVARAEHVKISLHTVADDACRKLHVDYVGLRLLCTYVGPGTQVLDEPGLDRQELARDEPYAIANPKIRRTATLVCAGEGDVLVLKGRSFPGNAHRGAVHRSPPIEGASRARLVLKIDAGDCGC